MSLTVAQLVARLTAETSGFYRGMALANASMIRTGSIISRVSAGAGIAVSAIGVASLVSAGTFERAMDIVQATSGASTKEMNKLSKEAMALGADLKLPNVSAKDAADAMVELGKAGFSTDQILKATRGTLQLGIAANIGFADAANITARALKAFQLDGSQASRVANLLAAAANASTADITDLAYGLQNASAQFQGAGYSIEDLNVALAELVDRGLSGEQAGTALKVMLQRLEAPTAKAKELMKEYGIKISDAKGNILPLNNIVEQFRGTIGKLNPAQRESILNTLFGARANQAMAKLMGVTVKQHDEYRKKIIGTNAAQKLAEARTKGFMGALGGLGSSIETILIKLGTPFLNAASQAARAMANWINGIDTKKITDFINKLADIVKWLINLVKQSPAVQAALIAIGTAFASFLIIQQIIGFVRGLTAAMVALNAVMLANPYVAIAAAIIALGAALVYLWKTNEGFRNAVIGVWDSIKGVVIPIIMAVKDAFMLAWGPLIAVAGQIWGGIKNVVMGALNVIIGLVKFFKAVFTGDWSAAWDAVKQIVSGVWQVIRGYVQIGIAVITSLAKTVAAPFIAAWNKVKSAAGDIWGGIKSLAISVWTSIENSLKNIWNGTAAAAKSIWNTITSFLKGIWNDLVRGAISFARDVLSAMVSAFGWTGLMGDVERAKQKLDKVLDDMSGSADKGGKKIKEKLGKGIQDIGTVITAAATEADIKARAMGSKVGIGIFEGYKPGWTKFTTGVKSTGSVVAQTIGSAGGAGYSVGLAVGNGIVSGFFGSGAQSRLAAAVRTTVQQATATANASMGSTTEQFAAREIGNRLVVGSAQGIVAGVNTLTLAVTGMVRTAVGGAATVAQERAMYLGTSSGRKMVTGFLLGTGDLSSKVSERWRTSLEAGKAVIDTYMAKYEQAFGRLTDIVSSAFDKITEQTKTPAEKLLEKLINDRDVADFQKRLQDAQIALREASTAFTEAQGMSDADLAAKYGLDPNDVEAIKAKRAELETALAEAQKTFDDLQFEETKRALEAQAAEERKQYDARRALQKQHLLDRLAQLEENLKKHPEREKFYQEKIIKLLGSYGITYKSVGKALGVAFAKGLEEALTEIEEAIRKIAKIIQKYLKIESPTELGPMSDLDHWWDNFAPTLMKGLNAKPIESAIASMVRPGDLPPAGMAHGPLGGPIYIQLEVGTAIGQDLESAGRELTEPIRRELYTIMQRNGAM